MSDFVLPEELTLYQVTAIQQDLSQAFEAGVRRFDLGGVHSLDSAGAQMLISLIKTAETRAEPIEWSHVSAETRQVLTDLGLERLTSTNTPLNITPV